MPKQRTWGGQVSVDGEVLEGPVDVSITASVKGGDLTFEEYMRAVALLLAPIRLLAEAAVWPLRVIGALLGRGSTCS